MNKNIVPVPSIKEGSKIPRVKTFEVRLSSFSVIIGILVIIGATAPFWNIWFDQKSTEKFLGFSNVSIFLYSFGNHFALFCCASFTFWIKNFIDPQYKKTIKIINIVGGIFVAISVYFLLWVFSPVSDFPKYYYEIAFITLAIAIAYGIYVLNNFIMRTILENKYSVKRLAEFIFRIRNKYFFPMAFDAINEKNRKKIEEDIDKFDEEVFETLEKSIKTDATKQQIEEGLIRSFRDLYAIDIDTKIATEVQRQEFDAKLTHALTQIAEMFYDHMLGNKMQKTMIFEIVENVLKSVQSRIPGNDNNTTAKEC